MPAYNLIDQPWMSLLDEEGALHEIGLQDALVKAHEWRELYTDSPMQTAALYRLLLALRLAIFPETLSKNSNEDWFALWDQGTFPEEKIRQYFQEHRRRFDLFDEEYPFYQDASLKTASKDTKGETPLEPMSLTKTKMFIEEHKSAVLFSHAFNESPRDVELAMVARGLVALQAAAPSDGGAGRLNGEMIPGKAQGALVNSAMFWIRGRSLFESLMLNAPPDIGIYPVNDHPTWERTDKLTSTKQGRLIRGPLDYLTWQVRRIHLCSKVDHDRIVVTGARMVQGENIRRGSGGRPIDPMMVLQKISSNKPYYYQFERNRALWRDTHVFLKLIDDGAKQLPAGFEWLRNQYTKLKRKRWNVDVFGISTGNQTANFDLWRHERMPLNVAYLNLGNAELRVDLRDCLDYAECMGGPEEKEKKNYLDREKHVRHLVDCLFIHPKGSGKQKQVMIRSLLYDACFCFAHLLRFPGAALSWSSENRLSGLSEEQSNDAEALHESLQPEARFWPALEAPFYKLLDDLARAHESFDESRINQVKTEWRTTVHRTAQRAFRKTVASFAQDARTLRALALAEEVLCFGYRPLARSDQQKPGRLL